MKIDACLKIEITDSLLFFFGLVSFFLLFSSSFFFLQKPIGWLVHYTMGRRLHITVLLKRSNCESFAVHLGPDRKTLLLESECNPVNCYLHCSNETATQGCSRSIDTEWITMRAMVLRLVTKTNARGFQSCNVKTRQVGANPFTADHHTSPCARYC